MEERMNGVVPSKEDYGELVDNVLLYGSVSLTLALAQETGIADILRSSDGPLTSTEISEKGNLRERYVREVLKSLTAARLVQLSEEDGTKTAHGKEDPRYFVPAQHREPFHRIAVNTLHFSACFRRYYAVKDCFSNCFSLSYVQHTDTSLSLLDTVTEYRSEAIFDMLLNNSGLKDKLEKGIRVAEVGCGFARPTLRLGRLFPASNFIATDVNPLKVQRSKEQACKDGITNVTFAVLDVYNMPDEWQGRFDWLIIVNVIHDLPSPQRALECVEKALKPGGIFSMVDELSDSDLRKNVGIPSAVHLYSMSTFLCLPLTFSYESEGSEALGAGWGIQKARAVIEGAGLKLMGVETNSTMATQAVYTCQKPEGR